MQLAVTSQDLWIETPAGRIFVRHWTPLGADPAAPHAPVVLFHDSLGCVELWRDFPQRLAATTGREVIAYDRLGFGRSDPHPGDWSNRFIRDEAERYFPQLLEALDIGPFVALGHSVGGIMAATSAARHPQRCQALITLSALAFVEERTRQGIRFAKQEFAKPGQLERLQKYHGEQANWVLAAWTETWLADSFADWTLESHAPSLACPHLVIHGKQDEYGSLLHPERLARLTDAGSESLILDQCSHFPHREEPERVLDAVGRFLARHAGAH
ncbi:alpha/beta fold hydrolase [Pseudomonas oryzae]|uniref:Pimeloyl-ACP methyl ester carboxylesterase n=1 Tax=Pseudomonas oryzae TaxID=1392877 RepID=A0A1H1RHF7_9PSED|nr:alpha/beta hydrolase [Pseudomonas oryzae]SDS35171.1 Pimeloyl-ACP methyl ester carboxylesterase [Pseudomonas oryzae]